MIICYVINTGGYVDPIRLAKNYIHNLIKSEPALLLSISFVQNTLNSLIIDQKCNVLNLRAKSINGRIQYVKSDTVVNPFTGETSKQYIIKSINSSYYTYEIRLVNEESDNIRIFFSPIEEKCIVLTFGFTKFKNKNCVYKPENKNGNQLTDYLANYSDIIVKDIRSRSAAKKKWLEVNKDGFK